MPINKKSQTDSYRVLYFGDSHSVMTMGKTLLQNMPKIFLNFENQAFFYAVSGATFKDWYTGNVQNLTIKNLYKAPGFSYLESTEAIVKVLPEEVKTIQPDVLILALGTNDILANAINFQEHLMMIKVSLEKLFVENHLQIIWIMPPEFHPEIIEGRLRLELMRMLKELKFVEVINVEKILPDQLDKIHFNKEKAKLFANEILKKLEAIFPHH